MVPGMSVYEMHCCMLDPDIAQQKCTAVAMCVPLTVLAVVALVLLLRLLRCSLRMYVDYRYSYYIIYADM